MMKLLLSLLLSLQLLLTLPAGAAKGALPVQAHRLMWGLIDPELSAWFARLPDDADAEAEEPVRWDWSWRGLIAALFGEPFPKEAAHAAAQL